MYAAITPAGLEAIVEAAPIHGQEVKRLFVDHLTDRHLAQLSVISRRVLRGLRADAPGCDEVDEVAQRKQSA
jgi:hypothetical protein